MTLYLQASGVIILTIILVLALKSHSKEISTVLSITACCMAAIVALRYLQPVIEFLRHIEKLTALNNDMVEILLKVTGIGIITEIASLVCKDAGNESMGKSMQLLGTAVVLYLSIPMFYSLIELLQKILGEL